MNQKPKLGFHLNFEDSIFILSNIKYLERPVLALKPSVVIKLGRDVVAKVLCIPIEYKTSEFPDVIFSLSNSSVDQVPAAFFRTFEKCNL